MQCLGVYAHVGKVLSNNDDDNNNNDNDLAQVADDHLTVKDQAKLFAIADVHEARKQKWARNIFFDPAGDETNKWGRFLKMILLCSEQALIFSFKPEICSVGHVPDLFR